MPEYRRIRDTQPSQGSHCLGTPIVYSPVKADLTGNIKVGRGVGGLGGVNPPGRDAVGLERGLKFMLVLLQSISDGERDEEHPNLIRVNAMKAYEIALKKYHGWMLQKLFTFEEHFNVANSAPPANGAPSLPPAQGMSLHIPVSALASVPL
ncbi:PREDICTED: glycolipid transfer protein [Pygoscelis adeliae]|uniref:glycolipid transfer protein n=1 Tax=Pygoscelis adeliae TaxID=9238 RepID=UPI0004F50465|nr:PREDICTED: glycolipid transfer protein [Pygoscelis adeliae]